MPRATSRAVAGGNSSEFPLFRTRDDDRPSAHRGSVDRRRVAEASDRRQRYLAVADQHPEVVAHLQALAKSIQAELGEGQQRGTGQRAVGKI